MNLLNGKSEVIEANRKQESSMSSRADEKDKEGLMRCRGFEMPQQAVYPQMGAKASNRS